MRASQLDGSSVPHDGLVRSKRRCLFALGVLVAVQVVAWRYQVGVVRSGWSLMLVQGSAQATVPMKQPLPATYVIRSEVIAHTSGLPIEAWFELSTSVVFYVSMPIWAFAAYPMLRFVWCGYRLAFHTSAARCERCGYDLAASRTGTCPECGWRRDWLRAFRRGLLDRL